LYRLWCLRGGLPVNVIGMKEEGDERTILRWKRNLKMKKCKVCGNYYAPWFQLEKFREKSNRPKDFFECVTPAGRDPPSTS